MRVLDVDECRQWLNSSGLVIDPYRRANEPYPTPIDVYALADDPKLNCPHIVREAMDWLPVSRERLMFIAEADVFVPDQKVVFEAIRRGCGATSDVAATPGHLFESSKAEGTHYEDRSALDVFEESVAMWLGGLALQWTWPGFFAVKDCAEHIELGDGYLRFVSPTLSRLEAARAVCVDLGMRTADRFPWLPK